ncbi:flagellin [Halosimplex aquaticum]|uniref:Flagellin n=1 Tax=Halosimplex aquaticum TaxID=3026162 RepID=A0ABD5Y5Z2_9EURY|nr:flagellin [Halosimplex aquaticum]
MGFSVSGSAALIFIGLFIAFGMWQTAASNSFERVSEAQSDRSDAALAEKNTDVVIDSATTSNGDLEITATNTGSVALSLNRTDVLVDNEYQTGWQGDVLFEGSQKPVDLWVPGEQITITVSSTGSHVKLVTESGVSDSEVVS